MKEKVTIVMDSGLGGLTFLDEVINLNVGGKYVYIADTLNAPYGEKGAEFIRKNLIDLVKVLNEKYEIENFVLACNTAAVSAQKGLQEEFSFPVISVVDATIEYFLGKNNLNIDWLATETTIKSGFLKKELAHLNINEVPCKKFVPLIESTDFYDASIREKVVSETIMERKANPKSDYVILGCTHYPYLLPELKKEYADSTLFFNPSVELAKKFESVSEVVVVEFYQTGDNDCFEARINRKYNSRVNKFAKKELEVKV